MSPKTKTESDQTGRHEGLEGIFTSFFFPNYVRRYEIDSLVFLFQIIEVCNTEVGRMRHMEELIHISKTLEFDKLRVHARPP